MIQTEGVHKVALEEEELEYLVNKKNEDVAALYKVIKVVAVVIVTITLMAAIAMFIIIKLSPDTFINRGEAPPNIFITSLQLMLLLVCVVGIATYYSYHKTLRILIMDIKNGEKVIEPCAVIRKFHSKENDTYHVYITSVVRLSIKVTPDEYSRLDEGDKVNIAYSPNSKIFFGYFI